MDVSPEAEERPIKMGLPLNDGHRIDHNKQRYPHCIVWTPIPCLTYVFGLELSHDKCLMFNHLDKKAFLLKSYFCSVPIFPT